MTLRRCRWGQPRLWDQSFRIFLATGDAFASALYEPSLPALPSLVGFNVRRGSKSLLQLLPQASRKIIGRMLDLYPESRAAIEEVRSDEWLKGIMACQKEDYAEKWGYEYFDLKKESVEKPEKLGFGYPGLLA